MPTHADHLAIREDHPLPRLSERCARALGEEAAILLSVVGLQVMADRAPLEGRHLAEELGALAPKHYAAQHPMRACHVVAALPRADICSLLGRHIRCQLDVGFLAEAGEAVTYCPVPIFRLLQAAGLASPLAVDFVANASRSSAASRFLY